VVILLAVAVVVSQAVLVLAATVVQEVVGLVHIVME
tara:strand:- start:161 stop:268 length:108 start_codon:yes stop_codon:yes gene_type:complete